MLTYISHRLLLMIPTLLGIMVINFAVMQFAPGGPVEQVIADLRGASVSTSERVGGAGDTDGASGPQAIYRGAENLPPEFIAELEAQFGFDRPPLERFVSMMGDYLTFDFGDSWFRGQSVLGLIIDKLPVSISLGLWSTLIIYLVSIPLGIAKAVRDGTAFDVWTSTVIFIGYAIPSFIIAIALIILFAGGGPMDLFPLRGLIGTGWEEWPLHRQIASYFWHMALPITALVLGGFAWLTMLTKNSFIDQLSQQYVLTARAKGLTERRVLYGHVFRNAMLIVLAGIPGTLIGILFTGVLLIELIFSLDGLGLLGFEAAVARDYPVVFATLYISSLIGLGLRLVADLSYVLVDPRIHFGGRRV